MKTRKLQISRFIFAFAGIFLWIACAKDEVDLYEEAPGIYFNGSSTTYNFAENPDVAEIGYDTVNIPLLITGTAVDYDRNVEVKIAVEDTVTASDDMYEILSGVVLAGSYSGQVKVKINYVPLMDDSVYVTKFKLEPTKTASKPCSFISSFIVKVFPITVFVSILTPIFKRPSISF